MCQTTRHILRIGLVSYLNAKPLYYGLHERFPNSRFIMDLPSRLARQLSDGLLDVALIPSIEYLRGSVDQRYIALSGCAIATKGPVRSVKILSHVPLGQIKRLALDEGSRTSQALCRIWLDQVHGVRPTSLEELPIGVPPEESTADAILVIGDRAMRLDENRFHTVADLGECWNQWTGLPFVFALWVARSNLDFDLSSMTSELESCRDDGLTHVDEIASEYAPKLGLDLEETRFYLTHQLSYFLDEPALAGLSLFAEKAAELELLPKGYNIVVHSEGNIGSRSSG